MSIPFPSAPVLMVDDEEAWLRSFSFALEYEAGIDNVLTCQDSRRVLGLLAEREVSLVLLDLNMPHLPGEELLAAIGREHPHLPVIVLSGVNQVETAVRCLKSGAFDYFVKTAERERLLAGVRNALTAGALRAENSNLKARLLDDALKHEAFADIVTGSRRMLDLFRYLDAVAPGREPVLIAGESGVGKELFARAVHRLSRPEAPWVPVNVAGLDDQVFSDTLFGHVKGAFTGAERPRAGMIEKAAGGTLFLDEIGDLSPASQVKLLRLLQDGEYFPLGSDTPRRMTARIVCATNQDLQARQQAGAFRKDLFYRLRTHYVPIPPLRERREDIPLLAGHFLEQAAAEFGRQKPILPPEAAQLLASHDFPGNVRELRGLIFDAVGSDRQGRISPAWLCRALGRGAPPQEGDGCAASQPGVSFGSRLPTLEESAELLVEEALRRSRGNQTAAARLLGISQPGLSKRIRKKKTDQPQTC